MPKLEVTDISVEVATPEQRRLAQEAVNRRDWKTFSQNQSTVSIHFGDRQIKLGVSMAALDRFIRDMRELESDGFPERMPGGESLKYEETVRFRFPRKPAKTAWERLDDL